MGDDIGAPVLWQRPNAKTYAYNQQVGGDYYKVDCNSSKGWINVLTSNVLVQ